MDDDAQRMMLVEGADLLIEVERDPAVRDPAVTLSEEGMETLRQAMTLWVASRMLRAVDPPQKVAVHIHVALDGKVAQ
jgi:hypothetical protein